MQSVCARALVGASGVTSAFAFCVGGCANRCIVGVCVLADVVTVRVRRSGFVTERNQHQGADGHCGVNDRGKNPCPCGWCARLDQQVTETPEAEHECARTDGCNRQRHARDVPGVYFDSDSIGVRATWRFGQKIANPDRIIKLTVATPGS